MPIRIRGAREHNLQQVDAEFPDGLSAVTGVSGSGKSSLVFDTLYREADRYFSELFIGSSAPTRAPALVDSINGLAPTVAIGQDLLNRNPNSTLASFSGLHPFLRLLFSRFGERACHRCREPFLMLQEDDLAHALAGARERIEALIVHQVPGSHETLLKVLQTQFQADRIVVDGSSERNSLAAGEPHDIGVLFDLPDDLRAARPLPEQFRSLGANVVRIDHRVTAISPVCAACGRWQPSLEAVHFKTACGHCHGKGCDACHQYGMHPLAAVVRWQEKTLPELLAADVNSVRELLTENRQVLNARLFSELDRRLGALQRAGLGYLQLSRSAPTLSRGEGQRVRLAVALVSKLEEIIHILDEPTIGLHPADVSRLVPAFRDLPGPVIFVEHDRHAVGPADYCLDIGPDAGNGGGTVTFSGTPDGLWHSRTLTGDYFSLKSQVSLPPHRETAERFITVRGAVANNLDGFDVSFAVGRINVVTGLSGSGKSTLVSQVLAESVTRGKPVGCESIESEAYRVVAVDQNPIGKNPRSNPATYTKLADIVREMFSTETGLKPAYFSFNRPEGACEECEGMGAIEMQMRYLPSNWLTCSACNGQRFSEEVLSSRVGFGDRSLNVAEFLTLSVDDALGLMADAPVSKAKRSKAERMLTALSDIGLGYLSLGQPSPSLSGGEAQRVKLAKYLGSRALDDKLLILDEPTTGLHPRDVAGLMIVLDRLVREGATLVVIEHNLDVIAGADRIIDLGPEAGPRGGSLLYEGSIAGLADVSDSLTAQAMREEAALIPNAAHQQATEHSRVIRIRGAAAHNLQNVDVDFPKGEFTVVTGVSGSGKSSLVRDVLETAARRRYLESLSMYERQGTSESSESQVESLSGLGVTLPLGSTRRYRNPRLTLGSATDALHQLAALMSVAGIRHCGLCQRVLHRRNNRWLCDEHGDTGPCPEPRHFIANIYGSACTRCQGMGSLRAPNIDKLIIHPEKPLTAGAMYSPGFYPQGYYGKPFNGGYDELQALAAKHGFDPFETPWSEMTEEARQAFLFGEKDPMQVVYRTRKGRTRHATRRFQGLFEILSGWDQGGTYTDAAVCPRCNGARLREEYLAVTYQGHNMHALCGMTVAGLIDALGTPDGQADHEPGPLQRLLEKLNLLNVIGLGYLNLYRRTATLSAGEAQRMSLVNVIASGLTGLTVLLDEPTRGMHPVEVERLLGVLRRVTALGNTVIVVEHDPDVILAADHLVDIGPGAGSRGGRIVAMGKPSSVRKNPDSATGRALTKRVHETGPRRIVSRCLTIRGARENNLSIDRLELPLTGLTGICGVSGSGKSTLIIDTLARAIAPRKHTTSVAQEAVDPGRHESLEGMPARCIQVDQGRQGIVSPLRFLNLLTPIQKLFADTDDARALGIDVSELSKSCTACKGAGFLSTDMGFLPDEVSQCEACAGSGYPEEIQAIRLQGLTLPSLLSLTVEEVRPLLGEHDRLDRVLEMLEKVGLGYLVLSQPARSLSGGEIQRLKLVKELSRKSNGDTLYLLDEPTTGLHLEDISRLLLVLDELVAKGNGVILIEHHLDVLAACDHLIELGPEGGPGGGRVIASGTPEMIVAADTATGQHLRHLLS